MTQQDFEDGDNAKNYELFRDSLSAVLTEKLSAPQKKTSRRRRKSAIKKSLDGHDGMNSDAAANDGNNNNNDDGAESTDADGLSEFIDYIATETFACLPEELQSLTHHTWADDPSLVARYPLPLTGSYIAELLPALDPSVCDSLESYNITNSSQGSEELLAPVLTSYITYASTPPPPPSSTKGKVTACEICGRDWINLSYHHLIPRFVHAKVVKRGWHRPDDLQNVAWLCGACHRFVHRFAGHEELARRYYTVDLLMEEEEVRRWAEWVGRLRWKKK